MTTEVPTVRSDQEMDQNMADDKPVTIDTETRDMTDKPVMTCAWSIDDFGGESMYETQCGHAFEFNDEGCDENGFRFCPYCGKPITELRSSEDEDMCVACEQNDGDHTCRTHRTKDEGRA